MGSQWSNEQGKQQMSAPPSPAMHCEWRRLLWCSKGSFVLGASANVTGRGTLEFCGGTGHELPDEVQPLVRVSGHGTVIFAGTNLTLERGVTVTVRHMFSRCDAPFLGPFNFPVPVPL